MVLLLVNTGNYQCCPCTSFLRIWRWQKSGGFSLPCLILVQSLHHVHKQKKSVVPTCVLLDFCDWTTVPLFATGEVLLDLKGNRFSVDFFLLFYFKPVLFLEGWQILSCASLMLSCQSSFFPMAQTADFPITAITLMKGWGLGSELSCRKIVGFYLKIRELDLNYCNHSYD